MPRVTVLVLVLVAAPSVVLAQPWPVEFAARRCEFERALALLDAEKPVPKDQWEHGILRARLLLQLERSKEALATLAKLPLPRTKEQQADFFFLSGMALALGKELQRALEALEKARAAGVDASLIDGAAGMAYLTAGKVTEAEQALLRALKDDPRSRYRRGSARVLGQAEAGPRLRPA